MITLFISDSVSDLIKYFALFMNYLMNDLPYHKENPLNRTVNTESTSIRQKEKKKKEKRNTSQRFSRKAHGEPNRITMTELP